MRLREDLARKLGASHQRVTHLTADNRHLKEALNKLTCDYHALREEFELIFAAHAQLRMERARTMEELAILRAAAREADAERRRFHKLDRFVAKHSSSSSKNASTFIEGSTTANCSCSSRKDLAVHGLSGNEDAMVEFFDYYWPNYTIFDTDKL